MPCTITVVAWEVSLMTLAYTQWWKWMSIMESPTQRVSMYSPEMSMSDTSTMKTGAGVGSSSSRRLVGSRIITAWSRKNHHLREQTWWSIVTDTCRASWTSTRTTPASTTKLSAWLIHKTWTLWCTQPSTSSRSLTLSAPSIPPPDTVLRLCSGWSIILPAGICGTTHHGL